MALVTCSACMTQVLESAPACPVCGAPVGPSATVGQYDGALKVGAALHGGDYSVGKVLGRGGFGITYLGADCRLKRATALKEFFPAGAMRRGTTIVAPPTVVPSEYDADRRRFLEEAQVLARFHHQSIVAVYDVFEENNTAYMVMEYLAGDTLASWLEQHGAAQEAELLALARPLTDALDLVHAAGVLHRDIKPDNIILAHGLRAGRPVLIDFGAAREFVRNRTMKQSVVLTPGYAPLEQYAEKARRGPYTDVYSLAATLYHLATGVQPPTATDRVMGAALRPPRLLNPTLSEALSSAIVHGLEMPIDRRPRTAREFFGELTGARVASRASGRTGGAPGGHPAPPRPMPHLNRFKELVRQLEIDTTIQTDSIACPVCRTANMIDPAKATGDVRCPVCRAAGLKVLVSPDRYDRCPGCRSGRLEMRPHDGPMHCPACQVGRLREYVKRRRFFILADTWARCDQCEAEFDVRAGGLTLMALPNGQRPLRTEGVGTWLSRANWEVVTERTRRGYDCPQCRAELDEHDDLMVEWKVVDGRLDRVPAEHLGQRRTRLAWAKIAHGIQPAFGTRGCFGCRAQFDERTRGELTLLGAPSDPYGTLARYDQATLPIDQWRRVAAGGHNPGQPGLICPACTTELREGPDGTYELQAYDRARDRYGVGTDYTGQSFRREDWQRLAAGKPIGDEERRLRDEARGALWAAYLAGEIANSAAERSYPTRRSGDERVLLSFAASQIRVRANGWYRYDNGQIWITTGKLLYQGARGNVTVPFTKVSLCTTCRFVGADALEIRRVDRVNPIYFTIADGHVAAGVDDHELELKLDTSWIARLIMAHTQAP